MKDKNVLLEELKEYDMDLYYDLIKEFNDIQLDRILDAIVKRDWYISLSYINTIGMWTASIISNSKYISGENQSYVSNYGKNKLLVLLDVYVIAVKSEWDRDGYDPECECECCSASVRYDPEVDGVCDEPDDETDRITGIEEQLTSIDQRLARLESMLTRGPVAVHLQYTAG